METSAQGITAPSGIYEIAGRPFDIGARGFADAVAEAHATHQRPRCMCLVEGVDMYVARLGDGFIVKRMPDTGSHHAPDCPSYEPAAEFSGLGQVLGSAISEDPATGETTLKLDFPLTKLPGRSTIPSTGGEGDSVSSTGTKLTLRGLLHYLWDQAELTRWHPGFVGKRTWATVRRHLFHAAEHKLARGDALRARLYVPEPFSTEERDAINSRRLAQWQSAVPAPGKAQQLMLLICEVKEIVPARYGFKAIVKHVPDQSFAIDEQLYRRLGRRFESELALWGASDDIHMVMIATFGVSSAGVPAIHELSLMPVTRQWLPVEDGFEKQLLDKLVGESRAFVKGLHYNLGKKDRIVSVALTDCEGSAPMLLIVPVDLDEPVPGHEAGDPGQPIWMWRRSGEAMPPLPLARTQSPRCPVRGEDAKTFAARPGSRRGRYCPSANQANDLNARSKSSALGEVRTTASMPSCAATAAPCCTSASADAVISPALQVSSPRALRRPKSTSTGAVRMIKRRHRRLRKTDSARR